MCVGYSTLILGDMLIPIDANCKRGLPLFVTATEAPELVIDTTLSVFLRRGRLPEPGEVLFATASITSEEVELLLRRWLKAGSRGREGRVFVLADLHVLSYAQQCGLVEKLREMLAELGDAEAATLLLVSGRPQQVAVNQLSQHYLDLPPLEAAELKKGLKHAFDAHVGATEVYGVLMGLCMCTQPWLVLSPSACSPHHVLCSPAWLVLSLARPCPATSTAAARRTTSCGG